MRVQAMKFKRAVISALISAIAPAAVDLIIAPENFLNLLSTWLVVFSAYYIFSLPVIAVAGWISVISLEKFRFLKYIGPVLVGIFVGFVFSKILYPAGTNILDAWRLPFNGGCTALVGCLIYFRPWSGREISPESGTKGSGGS